VEEIHAIEEVTGKEEVKDGNQTLITPDVGELLVFWKAPYVQEALCEPSQMERIVHTQCTIRDEVCELIIDGGTCTNLASTTLIKKL